MEEKREKIMTNNRKFGCEIQDAKAHLTDADFVIHSFMVDIGGEADYLQTPFASHSPIIRFAFSCFAPSANFRLSSKCVTGGSTPI